MRKKVLSFMIMLLVIIGMGLLLPKSSMTVQAAEWETDNGVYYYDILEDGKVEITDYAESENVTEIVIPAEMNGNSVTSIGESAFWG